MDKNELLPHRYKLCCVIMHLSCTMASRHIAYVKASNPSIDYFNFPCESIDCCGLQMYKNVLVRTANDNSVEEKRQHGRHEAGVQRRKPQTHLHKEVRGLVGLQAKLFVDPYLLF
ncbi:unnamed protein product [Phaedon cochleariae]|uniref:Uncharacterized protein n=1 Tax=Phaedon cochleariae TaxID=80249 RepID=A0A9N9WY61_PHACE|nr:unnamed protein product [Phaedon cochleariae]